MPGKLQVLTPLEYHGQVEVFPEWLAMRDRVWVVEIPRWRIASDAPDCIQLGQASTGFVHYNLHTSIIHHPDGINHVVPIRVGAETHELCIDLGAVSIGTFQLLDRPILDPLATFVFKLENDCVSSSSIPNAKGRTSKPMEWAEENSFTNQFSEIVS